MVFSYEDRILTEQLHHYKGYSATRCVKEFPGKGWKVCSLGRLLKKLKDTGMTSHQAGSTRLQSAKTQENIDIVGDIVCRQEGAPCIHHTVHQILRETGMHTIAQVIRGAHHP